MEFKPCSIFVGVYRCVCNEAVSLCVYSYLCYHYCVAIHRQAMMVYGNGKVLKLLIALMTTDTERVSTNCFIILCYTPQQVCCQACLAIRNLASDGESCALLFERYTHFCLITTFKLVYYIIDSTYYKSCIFCQAFL